MIKNYNEYAEMRLLGWRVLKNFVCKTCKESKMCFWLRKGYEVWRCTSVKRNESNFVLK